MSKRFIVAALLVSAAVPGRLDAQASSCRAADASTSQVIAFLREKVEAIGSEADQDRAQVGIPTVRDSQIVVIADPKKCTRLIRAVSDLYVSRGRTPLQMTDIYAIAIGSRYVVFHPSMASGEFMNHFIFDAVYALAGGWSG